MAAALERSCAASIYEKIPGRILWIRQEDAAKASAQESIPSGLKPWLSQKAPFVVAICYRLGAKLLGPLIWP